MGGDQLMLMAMLLCNVYIRLLDLTKTTILETNFASLVERGSNGQIHEVPQSRFPAMTSHELDQLLNHADKNIQRMVTISWFHQTTRAGENTWVEMVCFIMSCAIQPHMQDQSKIA
jgi:N-acyl-L-homoserine lactone synthetase